MCAAGAQWWTFHHFNALKSNSHQPGLVPHGRARALCVCYVDLKLTALFHRCVLYMLVDNWRSFCVVLSRVLACVVVVVAAVVEVIFVNKNASDKLCTPH